MENAWFQFVIGATLVIAAGISLTRSADALSRALGLGAGWAGLLILPLATSLPELVSSVRAALIDAPDLAVGNLFGSNLFNITILAVVDLAQGRGSLFHRLREGHVIAAALGLILLATAGLGLLIPFPAIFQGSIGLETLLLFGVYFAGAKLLTTYEKHTFQSTEGFSKVIPPSAEQEISVKQDPQMGLKKALCLFFLAAGVILFAGAYLTDASDAIAFSTGLGRTFVGSIFLAAATSLPEVTTTVTATRMGKLDMAVGNIFGANMYNMFILAIIDVVYRPGPLLGVSSPNHMVTVMMVIILTGLAIVGLGSRSKQAIGPLGLDSILIACSYIAAIAILFILRGG